METMRVISINLDQEQAHLVCRDLLAIISQLHLEWDMYHMLYRRLKKLGEIESGD